VGHVTVTTIMTTPRKNKTSASAGREAEGSVGMRPK
jgi:hypothetical protein